MACNFKSFIENVLSQEVPVQGARRARHRGHGPHRGLHPPLSGVLCGDPASHVGAVLTKLVHIIWQFGILYYTVHTVLMTTVQGDLSGRSKPPVDIDLKVAF